MWYKNVIRTSFHFATIHAFERRTDRRLTRRCTMRCITCSRAVKILGTYDTGSTDFIGCSNGVGRRALSSGAWHSNSGCLFPRLHAAAGASVQTSRWVLVPSRGYFAKPDLSVCRNVCINLFLETFLSYFSCCTRCLCFLLSYDLLL